MAGKTNAIRLLERAGVEFSLHEYPVDEASLDAVSVARALDADPGQVFKTLVTQTDDGRRAVFCVPGDRELHLKKSARVLSAKKLALIPRDSLLSLTGYIHGGCSPIGMKQAFPTWIDATAGDFRTIFVSAGVRGLQIEINGEALTGLIGATFADVSTEEER